MASEFEVEVERLREGRSTYEEFALATRRRWESMAAWLMRRWRVPGWVEPIDVVQELLLGAWVGVWAYEPGRGTRSLSEHVVYTACDKAKKKMHKARGAKLHGNPDNEDGHLDVPYSHFGEAGERMLEATLAGPPTQEEVAVRRQRVRRALAMCESVEEILVLQALDEADSVEGGVELVLGSEDAKRLLQVQDEVDAARVVVRVAGALAERFNDKATGDST